MTASLRERVLSRLIIEPETGCLLWALRTDRDGYARVWMGGRKHSVHRLMYEWFVGPIPDALTIDHLCRVRRCASPAHLEAVTMRENLLRGDTFQAANAAKTHCAHGHEFAEANTYVNPRGGRECRACRRAAEIRYRPRKRAVA